MNVRKYEQYCNSTKQHNKTHKIVITHTTRLYHCTPTKQDTKQDCNNTKQHDKTQKIITRQKTALSHSKII